MTKIKRRQKAASQRASQPSLSPITRLPPELLCHIFLSHSEVHGHQETVVVSQVCQIWRDLALNMSDLWVHIDSQLTNLEYTKAWLLRSKVAPLYIIANAEDCIKKDEFDDDAYDEICDIWIEALRMTLECLPRIRSLSINAPLYMLDHLSIVSKSILTLPTSLLEDLYLASEGWNGNAPAPAMDYLLVFLRHDAPHMKFLKTVDLYFSWPSYIPSSLTKLDIDHTLELPAPSVEAVFDVLESLTSLEELYLGDVSLPGPIPLSRTVSFPRLTVLKICCYNTIDLLQHFSLPCGPSLELSFESVEAEDVQEICQSLRSALRTCPPLRHVLIEANTRRRFDGGPDLMLSGYTSALHKVAQPAHIILRFTTQMDLPSRDITTCLWTPVLDIFRDHFAFLDSALVDIFDPDSFLNIQPEIVVHMLELLTSIRQLGVAEAERTHNAFKFGLFSALKDDYISILTNLEEPYLDSLKHANHPSFVSPISLARYAQDALTIRQKKRSYPNIDLNVNGAITKQGRYKWKSLAAIWAEIITGTEVS
ncbi:unnamed protein product [Somion occarium]|uniref:F-box domain-containing protein n=1 Tax=Somion occarium TaxID=3059160 RepID=A0ABP1DVQ4_9APHY